MCVYHKCRGLSRLHISVPHRVLAVNHTRHHCVLISSISLLHSHSLPFPGSHFDDFSLYLCGCIPSCKNMCYFGQINSKFYTLCIIYLIFFLFFLTNCYQLSLQRRRDLFPSKMCLSDLGEECFDSNFDLEREETSSAPAMTLVHRQVLSGY